MSLGTFSVIIWDHINVKETLTQINREHAKNTQEPNDSLTMNYTAIKLTTGIHHNESTVFKRIIGQEDHSQDVGRRQDTIRR